MTKAEVKYSINLANQEFDKITPCLTIEKIIINKLEVIKPSLEELRLKFNSSTECLEVYYCQRVSSVPSSYVLNKDYDVIDGNKYAYIKLDNKTLMKDIFDFSSIKLISLTKDCLEG